jgi:pimeloyl-ACP methyl ester carboxylesterase
MQVNVGQAAFPIAFTFYSTRRIPAMIELEADSGVRDTQAQSRQIGAKWHGGRLSELRVPALVLHGDDDQILRPAAGRDTARAIPGARLVTYPGVGHDIPRELWPSVASEIRALARPPRPALGLGWGAFGVVG